MLKLIITLTVICVVASFLLGITNNLTKDKIKIQEQKEENRALSIVFPNAEKFSYEEGFYKASDKNDNLVGYALIGEGQGYSSIIKVMVGIDTEGNVKGIKILSQQETPGLGDRIDKPEIKGTIWDLLKGKKIIKKESWFQTQFETKKLDEIQTITGATISSKAVIEIVKNVIEKFKQEQGVE